LWHGPSWNFVIWGTAHGVGLAAVRLWQSIRGKRKSSVFWHYAAVFATFQFVAFAWIYFRAPDFQTASAVFGRIGSHTFSAGNISPGLWMVMAVGFVFHYLPKNWYDFSVNLYSRAPFYAQAAALVALALGLQYVAQTGAAPFIYTKF
jgi:alginate O-acetyltransferase complex protein AlgI